MASLSGAERDFLKEQGERSTRWSEKEELGREGGLRGRRGRGAGEERTYEVRGEAWSRDGRSGRTTWRGSR